MYSLAWAALSLASDIVFLVAVSLVCDDFVSHSLGGASVIPVYVVSCAVFLMRAYHYAAFVRTLLFYSRARAPYPLPYSDLQPLIASLGHSIVVVCLLAAAVYNELLGERSSFNWLLTTWTLAIMTNAVISWSQDDRPKLRRFVRGAINHRRRHDARATHLVFASSTVTNAESRSTVLDSFSDSDDDDDSRRHTPPLSPPPLPPDTTESSGFEASSDDELIDVQLSTADQIDSQRASPTLTERTEPLVDFLSSEQKTKFERKTRRRVARGPPPPKPPKIPPDSPARRHENSIGEENSSSV